MAIMCAFILLCGHALLADETDAVRAARDLYTQAAQAIADDQTAAAIDALQTLLENHEDFRLAETAAYHLAECLWLEDRADDALQVLEAWFLRITSQAARDHYAAELQRKTETLIMQVLHDLPADRRGVVRLTHWFEIMDGVDAPHIPTQRQQIAVAAASRLESIQDYVAAQQWLQTAIDLTGDMPSLLLRQRLHFELPVAWAEHERSCGRIDESIRILERVIASEVTEDQLVSARFLLAEYLLAAGHRSRAMGQLEWLEETVQRMDPKPAWSPSLTLRRAELLVASGQYSAAHELLLSGRVALAKFPRPASGFDYQSEFEFLLARCAIARIDFEAAAEHLQRIIHGSTLTATADGNAQESPGAVEDGAATGDGLAVARAQWMLGEIDFLQQKYASAIASYAQVIAMDQVPEWQARARLQSAKCYELLGQSDLALEIYHSIDAKDDMEASRVAADRIAAIESRIRNLR